MTFTEWFFTWPCLVVYIAAVCAARIAVDHCERKQDQKRTVICGGGGPTGDLPDSHVHTATAVEAYTAP